DATLHVQPGSEQRRNTRMFDEQRNLFLLPRRRQEQVLLREAAAKRQSRDRYRQNRRDQIDSAFARISSSDQCWWIKRAGGWPIESQGHVWPQHGPDQSQWSRYFGRGPGGVQIRGA